MNARIATLLLATALATLGSGAGCSGGTHHENGAGAGAGAGTMLRDTGGSAAKSGAGGGAGANETGGSASAGTSGTGSGGFAGAQPDAGMLSEGCTVGGVRYPVGAMDIPGDDACNTCSCSIAGLSCTKLDCGSFPLLECVVAQRFDECCVPWAPVSGGEAHEDECIVGPGEARLDDAAAAACMPDECAIVQCPVPTRPISYVATPTNDACRFADECDATNGCTLAYDARVCCPCPRSMPKALVDFDPCLIEVGAEEEAPAECIVPCPRIACAPCPDVPEPSCLVRDSFSLCH